MSFTSELLSVMPGAIPTGLSVLRGFQLNTAAGLAANPTVNYTPITIGGFELVGFEAPRRLNVGGQQKLAVHDFPGGVRTVQSLGAFPPEEITWEGIFLGANAWERAYALDRLRVAGSTVSLLFGSWGYTGKIKHIEINVHHQWMCQYEMFFIPESDLAVNPQVAYNTPTMTVNASMSTLSSNVPTTEFGDTLPMSVVSPVSSLMSAVSIGLNDAGGIVSNMTSSAVSLVKTAANSVLNGVEGLLSTPGVSQSMQASGLLVASNVTNISNQVSATPIVQNTVVQNNPNLMQLAAQYYGDSSQWLKIAQANNITDRMPTGTFTLGIPA